MDALERLRVFAKVASLASFSATARELGLAQSQVSRAIRAVEEEVGVALLVRSTRAVSLTTEGRRYLEGVCAALSTLDATAAVVRDGRDRPSGTLRVSASPDLAEILGPVLGELAVLYPDLGIDAVFTHPIVDLVAEGFDVAIRTGSFPPSDLHKRKLGATRSIVCAAPAYLERRGTPRLARDLRDHELAFSSREVGSDVVLRRDDDRRARIHPEGRLWLDDPRAIFALCLAGGALALLPEERAASAIAAKELVRLLPRWATAPVPIHALLPPREIRPARVRVFLDAAEKAIAARAVLAKAASSRDPD